MKHKILSSTSAESVTAATGTMTAVRTLHPACGVVGMAGVGKTIALQGLAADEEICLRFPGGVLYMTIGQGATVQDVKEEIANIMKMTGASSSLADVRKSISLREAVNLAVQWFRGKTCLFLLDDLWPIESCIIGYFNDLRQLLRCSRESRMAISTRSVNIAIGAGCVVDFAARDPLVSVNIFMSYATSSMPQDIVQGLRHDLCPNVSKILSFCAGLPIALSISGSAIAYLTRTLGTFESACEIYVTDFEHKATNLGDERNPEGKRLNDCIRLSLQYLEAKFTDWKERNSVNIEFTISDLYTSLSVLTNQVWVPVSVLSRMWKLEDKSALDIADMFCGMSLASFSYRKIGEDATKKAGINLHDLHLEFCRQQAKSKNLESSWHTALLLGYLKSSPDTLICDPCTLSSLQLAGLTPRPWWTDGILDDGYIYGYLARHLSLSGQGSELAALLLDARWITVRGKRGGFLGIMADFEVFDKLMTCGRAGEILDIPNESTRNSFRLILKAVQLSWGRFFDGQRAFQFQLCGRLLMIRSKDVIIDAFLRSFEEHTPKPYLQHVSCFFPDLDSPQIREIPVGGGCYSVACSPCGRFIAAGSGSGVVLLYADTGDIVKRLHGRDEIVKSVSFVGGSKKIVSASGGGTVAVWEWKKSDSFTLVLEGHSDCVHSIAVSRDGDRIISGSRDGTLRVWNANTGLQIEEFAQLRDVYCVALCADNRTVAIGLETGALKVLDSCTGQTLFEDAKAHKWRVLSAAFSPDGRLLATSGGDWTVRLWNAATWTSRGLPIEGHSGVVCSLEFSPDGLQLVSGSTDGTVRLWDVTQEDFVGNFSNISSLSERAVFSSDIVSSATFASGGARIISGSHRGFVRVWDAHFDQKEEQRTYAENDPVRYVSISPDGLKVAGSKKNTVHLWNAQTGAIIGVPLEGHTDRVTCVSFSPDGRMLVSGSWDKTLRLWDLEAFTQVQVLFEWTSHWAHCVSFSADGLRIVSGSTDRTVRLWNVETREQIGDPLKHEVWPVIESSDGRFIVSGAPGGETYIWDRVSTTIVWKSVRQDGSANNAITNSEAESVIRTCGDRTPRLWPTSFPEYVGDIYCEEYSDAVYSSVQHEKVLLGNLPSSFEDWRFNDAARVFTAGLLGGGIAICRLVK